MKTNTVIWEFRVSIEVDEEGLKGQTLTTPEAIAERLAGAPNWMDGVIHTDCKYLGSLDVYDVGKEADGE